MTKWERVFPVMNIVMSLPGFVLISRTSSFKSVMKLLHLGGGGISSSMGRRETQTHLPF